jgi:hypothetical protein
MVSLRALTMRLPIPMSPAKNGIKPQRISCTPQRLPSFDRPMTRAMSVVRIDHGFSALMVS